jgi:hypothetical protein
MAGWLRCAGFNTTKGALVRAMLFPKAHTFKSYADSARFVGVLAVIGKRRAPPRRGRRAALLRRGGGLAQR